jgi:hypothetical protein
MPVTQRHTISWHHLEADLRFRAAWSGLLEIHGSLVEVLVEVASSGGTGTSSGAGARNADPGVADQRPSM